VGELVEATGLLKARKVLTACNAMEELFLELLEEENAGA
jgi:hypothetical protein